MGVMTRAHAERVLERLAAMPPDATPLWGTMTAAQMVGHLNAVVRYTMGEGQEMPYRGNWKSRFIFRTLILRQIVRMPRNVRLPRADGTRGPRHMPDGTVDALRETLEEYFQRLDAGTLPARVHPFFGVLSAADWRRMHYAHFQHHLAQFER